MYLKAQQSQLPPAPPAPVIAKVLAPHDCHLQRCITLAVRIQGFHANFVHQETQGGDVACHYCIVPQHSLPQWEGPWKLRIGFRNASNEVEVLHYFDMAFPSETHISDGNNIQPTCCLPNLNRGSDRCDTAMKLPWLFLKICRFGHENGSFRA